MNYPHLPAVGKTDTSAAAAPARQQAKTLQNAVIRVLKSGPATADAAAAILQESVLAIRPRFSELRAQGRIEDTGERRKNASGHRAIVWKLSPLTETHVAV